MTAQDVGDGREAQPSIAAAHSANGDGKKPLRKMDLKRPSLPFKRTVIPDKPRSGAAPEIHRKALSVLYDEFRSLLRSPGMTARM